MPQIVKAFEQFLIETQTPHHWEADELVFQHENRGNPFTFAVTQRGNDGLEVLVAWVVILPADDFEVLGNLLGKMASAGFIFGDVYADDEYGCLVDQCHFHFDEAELSAGAVRRMMSQLLRPFSQAVDRILQVMVGIFTSQQAVENFGVWCQQYLMAADQHKTRPDSRHLFD